MHTNLANGRIGASSSLNALKNMTRQYSAHICEQLVANAMYGYAAAGDRLPRPYAPKRSATNAAAVASGRAMT